MNPLTILGTAGRTLPRATNKQVLAFLEAPHDSEWLMGKSGIEGHSLNFDPRTGSKLTNEDGLNYALEVARDALKMAQVKPSELNQLCYTTCTPRYIHFMADAIEIHKSLDLSSDIVVDYVDGGCAALAKVFQNVRTNALAANNPNWKALIVASNDVMSMLDLKRYKRVPYSWLSPAIFGDGAAALVLGPGEGRPWLHSTHCGVDGKFPLVHYKGGGTAYPTSELTLDDHVFLMDAPEVARQFVKRMNDVLKRLQEISHVEIGEVERWYLHQANLRLIEKFISKRGLQADRVPHNADTLSNTVSASTLLLLHDDVSSGRKFSKPVEFAYVGAGMMYGGAVFMPD